mgnify:CR=1 FL=1
MSSCINMHDDEETSEEFEDQDLDLILESFEIDIRKVDQSIIDEIVANE